MPVISPKTRRLLVSSAAALYAVSFVSLAIYGGVLWRLNCEGFGCIGEGIGWAAWSLAYAIALPLGYVAQRCYQGMGGRTLRIAVALQAIAGTMLFAYWVAWRAA